jgi:hypothetical protein
LSVSLVLTAPGSSAYAAVGRAASAAKGNVALSGTAGASLNAPRLNIGSLSPAVSLTPSLSVAPALALPAPAIAPMAPLALPAPAAAPSAPAALPAPSAAPAAALQTLSSPETAAAVAEMGGPGVSGERGAMLGRVVLEGGKASSDKGEGVLGAVGARAPSLAKSSAKAAPRASAA